MSDESSFKWHGYWFEHVAAQPMVDMSGEDDGEFPEHFSVQVDRHDNACLITNDPEAAKRELLDHLVLETLPELQSRMAELVAEIGAMQAELSAERYSEDKWPQPDWYRKYRKEHPIAKITKLQAVKR